ncbi:hypothetical protein GCM10022296_11990 [Secundilactobacillus similis DSM 23365 = JCM 2765]|uniref:Gram-positive cocci surface proteins LPxTG domain-containing protein n=1 Tax=Secundilactobacillus similis DSM 23365 = JCM 2765 TaxID=1423804 RepID=A0A0R2ETI3_9LACO|nr:hypothetical protein [Secundilactobacillus similis]KRN18491.1 hypothetical protein FD14_GL002032 [Secundilactobacillus similis DSM 23365 = JCM 2765]
MQITKRLMTTILVCDAVLLGTMLEPNQAKAATATDSVSQESTVANQDTSETTLTASGDSSLTPKENANQTDTSVEKVGKEQPTTSAKTATGSESGASDTDKTVTDMQDNEDQSENQQNAESDANPVKSADEQNDKQKPQLNADAQKAIQPIVALTAVNNSVQAGADASFTLTVSVPGDITPAKDQQLVVQLPTNFDLDPDTDLAIADVTPTTDDVNRTVTYDFGNTLPGTSLSKQFSLTTAGQPLANNTELTLGTQLLFDKQVVAEATQSVVVVTKAELDVSNTLVGIIQSDADGNPEIDSDGNKLIRPDLITGTPGDYAVYQATITVPKVLGQAYLAPGSVIALNVYLPSEMMWTTWQNGPTVAHLVDDDNQIISSALQFRFTAPSYEEQEANVTKNGSLFSIDYMYITQLSQNVEPGTQLTVVTQAGATMMDGDTVASQQIGTQMTVAEKLADQTITEREGEFHYTQTYASPTKQITPDGTLQFTARISAGYALYFNDSRYSAFTGHDASDAAISKFIINYMVDPHLNADLMFLSDPVEDHGNGFSTLQTLPKFDLYVKYQDDDQFEATSLKGYTAGAVDLNQYVDNNRGVEQLQLVFTTIPNGMSYYNGVGFQLSPKSGYYGTVTSDWTVEVGGMVYGGYYDILYSKDGATVLPGSYDTGDTEKDVGKDYNEIHLAESGWSGEELVDEVATRKSIMASQSAEIVKPAESAAIINENATFAKADNGVVNEGDNQLQIRISNDEVATDYLTGVTTSVVLPKGVSYNGNVAGVQVLDSDYQGTGQTLLGITWANDAITPGRANTVSLPVTVAAVSGLNQLSIGVYSKVDGDTATALNSDQLDATVPVVAGNYDFLDANRLAFGRMITYGSTLTQDATLVRLIGTTLSQIAAGQTGTANLQFSKDTADALNQLTVTGSVVSGTGLTLNGPVTLPDNWQNQATVIYTTETDPTTATNWQSAESVTDFSQVTGFKIRYQKSGSYLAGGAQTIAVPVTLAETTNLGQMVGLVYTVAADNLPAVDGIQSVIDVTAPAQIKTAVGPAVSVTADDYYDYTHPITKTAVGPAVSVTADQYYDHTVPDTTMTTNPGDNSNPQPGETDEPQTTTPVQGKSQLDKLQQPAKKISLTGIPLHLQPLTISTSTDVQFGTAVLESGEPADSSTTGNNQQATDRTTADGTDDSTKSSTSNSQGRTDNEATTNESHNSAGVASNRTGVRGMSATTVNGRTQNSQLANGQNSVQAGTTASKPDEKGRLPQTAEKALLWAALLGLIGLATATWYKLKKLRKNE